VYVTPLLKLENTAKLLLWFSLYENVLVFFTSAPSTVTLNLKEIEGLLLTFYVFYSIRDQNMFMTENIHI